MRQGTFHVIVVALSLLFQGCGSHAITYVQAYYDRTLKGAEIAWITVGTVSDKDEESSRGIEVMFEGLPQETHSSPGLLAGSFEMFAFPVGKRTLKVRYYDGSSWTKWVEISKTLEGGKCYEINDRVRHEGGLFPPGPTWHKFTIEESSCSRGFSGRFYDRVELYRLGGYTAMPTLKLIKSYDFNDDVFSPLRSKNKNNVTVITVPCEFIRKVYEKLE